MMFWPDINQKNLSWVYFISQVGSHFDDFFHAYDFIFHLFPFFYIFLTFSPKVHLTIIPECLYLLEE